MTEKYSSRGYQNLSYLQTASRFTDWMYEQIKPQLTGSILEIGSGIGTYSKKIVRDFPENKIILSDFEQEFIKILKKEYKSKKNVSVIPLDLNKKTDFGKIKKIDCVVALNVLEHIENDVRVLNNIYSVLNCGGKLILLVPAHKFLENCIDQAVGHFRRYTKKELLEKVKKTRFVVKKVFYFNFFSIFGWYINGNILKKEIIDESKMKFFNQFVPFFRFFENNILKKKIGISLIVVLEK